MKKAIVLILHDFVLADKELTDLLINNVKEYCTLFEDCECLIYDKSLQKKEHSSWLETEAVIYYLENRKDIELFYFKNHLSLLNFNSPSNLLENRLVENKDLFLGYIERYPTVTLKLKDNVLYYNPDFDKFKIIKHYDFINVLIKNNNIILNLYKYIYYNFVLDPFLLHEALDDMSIPSMIFNYLMENDLKTLNNIDAILATNDLFTFYGYDNDKNLERMTQRVLNFNNNKTMQIVFDCDNYAEAIKDYFTKI